MASISFPTTLSEITFHDDNISSSLYHSLRDIRRATLSISNRLRSVTSDAKYVQSIAKTYSLPLIANERCGSWYIDPSVKAGSAYFKSTDGHHGQWNFSPRRLNVQILPIIGDHGGAILVDSTRRGKNMPDAFLKTVPIWVAVMNQALFPDQINFHELQTPPPPNDLSQSEVSQIEAKIPQFVAALKNLDLDLQQLRRVTGKPITLNWVVNSFDISEQFEKFEEPITRKDQDYHRLILCSASRRVAGAEVSEGGYIQGAGDDSEAWSHGLSPQLFWKHKRLLMDNIVEEDLPSTIAKLLEDDQTHPSSTEPRRIHPTSTLYIGPFSTSLLGRFDAIVDCSAKIEDSGITLIGLGCRNGKLGSRDLRNKLADVVKFIRATLTGEKPKSILVSCFTRNDLSAGVALALLCLFYNDQGDQNIVRESANIDKTFIKKRLAWISSSLPDVNPSRATLQSVHSFLMERP